MAESLAPIDTSVTVPPAVKAAGEAANALHKAAYPSEVPAEQQAEPGPEQQAEPQPDQQPSEQHPEQQAVPQPQPERRAAPVPESGEHGSWEHRYLAMKGRFDQSQITLGQMQEQMSELGDELQRTTQALQMARAGLAGVQQPQRAQRPQQPRAVTEADVETYGPELIDFVTRAARGAVAPDLQQVSQQARQANQAVRQTAQQRMEADLDASLPDWRQINVSQRFKQWSGLPDIYSRQVRRNLINDAAKAADAPRVAAFFRAFLAEEQATGQMPAPQGQPSDTPAPRQAAVSLDSLASPGRAKPASGNGYASAADKPVFTRAQIRAFYSNEGRAAYAGREADRKNDEQEIYAAQREGRVR